MFLKRALNPEKFFTNYLLKSEIITATESIISALKRISVMTAGSLKRSREEEM
ncbi:hypothetical protein [Methanoplanus limicola]|uniref:hypothetical protein n=1 Tax=Methanoplanus limicola TaxID=2315 RepID=UPI0012F65828|nr:hypothetical protein [Methanoplanus limicola]